MSLVITAVILAIIGIGYTLVRHRSQPIAWFKEFLRGPVGMFLFTLGRFLVGIVGVSVLFVTLLPGLSPLQAYLDPNLGLGGLIYFFIWPLIVLQIVVAFFPYKRAWVVSKPLAA